MHGVDVLVQAGAGTGSSLSDEDYRRAGAEIVDSAAEVWERAELICKVKEPLEHEFAYFRDDLTLFTYLHLAAYPEGGRRPARRRDDRHRLRDGAARRRPACRCSPR